MAQRMQPRGCMVAVPAEKEMLSTSNWQGAVGFTLGGQLYPASFPVAGGGAEAEFKAAVESLCRKIVSLVPAPSS